MRIMFNGIIEKRKSGCKCSGGRTDTVFISNRIYTMPSGTTKRFRAGKVEEVSDIDGNFLLSYTYQVGNEIKRVFEVV